MSTDEQEAFIEAYGRNVAFQNESTVRKFLKSYLTEEDISYSGDYTSIVDSLLIWNEAVSWTLKQMKETK